MPGTGPSFDSVRLDARAVSILIRGAPGFASLYLAWSAQPTLAAACLVLAVWCDVLAGWLVRRRKWPRKELHAQLEAFIDFICFVWAPVEVLIVSYNGVPARVAALVFILAGLYRIARFNVEGLVNGRYRGLPVTYNGYLIPLLLLGAHYVGDGYASALCSGVLLLISALMVSRRIMVPEF